MITTSMAEVLTVNVGPVREVALGSRAITTAIWKEPVEGRIPLEGVNFRGDDQADRTVHGGMNDPPPPGSSISFTKEGKCFVKEGGDTMPESMSFTFDPKKDPAEIDISEPRAGMGEKAIKGIYKIDGDTLTICLHTYRKNAFTCCHAGTLSLPRICLHYQFAEAQPARNPCVKYRMQR